MEDTRRMMGRNIREARKRLGITQEQLAERLGISTSQTISDIEKGARSVKALELKRIAEQLRVDFYDLLGPAPLPTKPMPLWRAKPDVNKGEVEALLHLRNRRFKSVRDALEMDATELPLYRQFDPVKVPYPDIEAIAAEARKDLGLGIPPGNSLCARLADPFAVMIFHQDLGGDGSALCVRSADGAVMLLNSAEVQARRLFSCAHELYHLLTWDSTLIERVASSSDDFRLLEKKAGAFASALLMPIEELQPFLQHGISQGKIGIEYLVKTANHFGVSTSALLWRMVSLQMIGRDKPSSVLSSADYFSAKTLVAMDDPDTASALPESYVRMAFLAHVLGRISRARLAEYLETTLPDLPAVLASYGYTLDYRAEYDVSLNLA